MCPFWPLLHTEYVFPLTNLPQLLYMQEKDFVDADTSQSLYELHICLKWPLLIFVHRWKQACVYTVERTAHCKSWVELQSYGATMYCRATELPAWTWTGSVAAGVFQLRDQVLLRLISWLDLLCLQLSIIAVDLARQVMPCLPWLLPDVGGDTIALHHYFDQWIQFAWHSPNLTYNAVNLTRLIITLLGGVWVSQVELNFDLALTCRDVVGDAVAGALLLHLLVVLIEHVELVVELNFDLVENCRCGGRRLGWCSPSPPTWPTLPPMLSPLCCSFRQ